MIMMETKLNGLYMIEPERLEDNRGFFARIWCEREFKAIGINPKLAQCSISFNRKKGTLRGMHYQDIPYKESKLVRCTMGAVYDVAIDLRPESNTFRQWISMELTAENRKMIYIPEGFAHGFLTLADNTEVFYQISEFYMSEYSRGVRWNDPAFRIHWPDKIAVISDRDQNYPDFLSYKQM